MSVVPLRRVARVVPGGTPTPDPENWGGGVAWATPVDLGRVDGSELSTTERTLTTRGLISGSKSVPANSLMLSTRAPIGYIARTASAMAFNQGCKGLVLSPRVDPRFLSYQLWAARDELQSLGTGSTFLELSTESILAFAVHVPKAEVQRRVADFLDDQVACIDEIIRLRGKQRTAFELRFRGSIRQAFSSNEQAAWATRLQSGWTAAPLRYVSTIQRGASPRPIDDSRYFDDEGTHAWVRIADVTASRRSLNTTTQRLSPLGRLKSVSLKPGELIVSIAASVGKPIITEIPCCIHDGFVAVRRPRFDPRLLYYAFLLGDCFEGLGKLGTQLNLNSETIGGIRVPTPRSAREQERVVADLAKAEEEMWSATDLMQDQITLLHERKRSLITAAVTGEFDVSAASGRGVA